MYFGIGYFQFFGQSDAIGSSDPCVALPNPQDKVIYRAPWYFDVTLGGGPAEDAHRFVMIDTNDLWTKSAGASGHGQTGWSPQYSWVSQYKLDANGNATGTLTGLPNQRSETAPQCVDP